MTLTITIDCDNAAFEDNPSEVADILRKLATTASNTPIVDMQGYPVIDTNGNRVGDCLIS